MQQEAATGCTVQEPQRIAPGADAQQDTDAVGGGSSIRSQMPLMRQLMSAVKAGDSSRVPQLLDSAKADMTEGELAAALCCMAATGHNEVVAAVLAAGVPVDAAGRQGWSALHHAAVGGHVNTLQVLLKAGADVGTRADDGATPLFVAAAQGHLLVVRELLAAGADCDARCVNGFTPLHLASMRSHLSVVEALLAAGADVEADAGIGATPLCVAASRGHADVVRLLMSGGAVRNKQQWTFAATAAAARGHLGVIDALLAAPAEVQEHNLLLAQACMYGQTAMVEHLLSIGLQSSLSSLRGYSALEAAAAHGHVDAVVLLLRASKQQAPTHAQVLNAASTAAQRHDYNVLAQLLLHLCKSGDSSVPALISTSGDCVAVSMALLQGWAADAAQQQQQQHQVLVALEQDMAGSRPVVMGLLFAVQHPALRAAAEPLAELA